MCWRPHISWCMLPGWWSSVWEISEVQINWDCCSSYRVAFPPQLLPAFPNSTTGVSSFCPLVGCKYLHLTLLAACCVFRRAAMIDPSLWAHHSINNSVMPWGLPLSCISHWAGHWTSFSSVFDCGMATPPLHMMPCLSTGGGLNMLPLLTVGYFI